MRYAFFHVYAYIYFYTFTTILLSFSSGPCIHRLGNIGFFYHGNTEHEENLQRFFFNSRIVRLWAFSRVWVWGSLGCSFVELVVSWA